MNWQDAHSSKDSSLRDVKKEENILSNFEKGIKEEIEEDQELENELENSLKEDHGNAVKNKLNYPQISVLSGDFGTHLSTTKLDPTLKPSIRSILPEKLKENGLQVEKIDENSSSVEHFEKIEEEENESKKSCHQELQLDESNLPILPHLELRNSIHEKSISKTSFEADTYKLESVRQF